MSAAHHAIYEKVTNTIRDRLLEHTLTWEKPWVYIPPDRRWPYNISTGKEYRGINTLLLSIVGHTLGYIQNGWLTYKQTKAIGATVSKGQKGIPIIFYQKQCRTADGTLVDDEELEAHDKMNVTSRIILRQYIVFNISQCEGVPEELLTANTYAPMSHREMSENARMIIGASRASVIHRVSNMAYYDLHNDVIVLPEYWQFDDEEKHFGVLLHELGHWTGYKSRLNRSWLYAEGKREYAKEELVAELTKAFVCARFGYTLNITNSVAYIQQWLCEIERDMRFFVVAVNMAFNASEYLMGKYHDFIESVSGMPRPKL